MSKNGNDNDDENDNDDSEKSNGMTLSEFLMFLITVYFNLQS